MTERHGNGSERETPSIRLGKDVASQKDTRKPKPKDLSIWETHSQYSVKDAACLMAGVYPSCVGYDSTSSDPNNALIRTSENSDFFDHVYGCYKRLIEASYAKELAVSIIFPCLANETYGPHQTRKVEYSPAHTWCWENPDMTANNEQMKYNIHNLSVMVRIFPDWEKSTVQKDHIIKWLKKISFNDRFFNPIGTEDNPRSSKLDAANKAFREVTNPDSDYYWKKFDSPTEAITNYLTANAKELGLTKKQGETEEILQDAISKIATVANWDYKTGPKKGRRG